MEPETREPASTRRVSAAAVLLREPFEAPRVIEKLKDDELSQLGELLRLEQSKRALARGDLDEIILQAFETGFGRDGLGVLPWVHDAVVVCPGAIVWSSRTSHTCRFISVDDIWIWKSHELIREDKRDIPGTRDGFRAIGLLPALEGMELDVVTGKARNGQHSMTHVVSYIIRRGKLVEVSQRSVTKKCRS